MTIEMPVGKAVADSTNKESPDTLLKSRELEVSLELGQETGH